MEELLTVDSLCSYALSTRELFICDAHTVESRWHRAYTLSMQPSHVSPGGGGTVPQSLPHLNLTTSLWAQKEIFNTVPNLQVRKLHPREIQWFL